MNVYQAGSVPYAGMAGGMLSDARVRLTSEDVFWVDMRVRILYFGVLKDVMEREREERDLPEGGSVGELLAMLQQEAASEVWGSVAVAVNREYARSSAVLCDGDELALLPPVSGGNHAH